MTVAEMITKVACRVLGCPDEESDPINTSSVDESDSGPVVRNCALMNA